MKRLKLNYLTLLFVLVFGACDDGETFVEPEIKPASASDVTNTTAVINAEVIEAGSDPIIKYGFVWTEYQSNDITSLDDGTVIYLNGTPTSGSTISTQLTNLERGKHYIYNAFIQTEKDVYMHYYDKGFSLIQPEITGMNPKEGVGGTVVTLTGKYLSDGKDVVSVKMYGEKVEVLEATENEIRFVVPEENDNYYDGTAAVVVSINGVQATGDYDFSYLKYFKLDKEKIKPDQQIGIFVKGGLTNNSETNRPNIEFKINGQSCEVLRKTPVVHANSHYAAGFNVYFQTPENLEPGIAGLEVKRVGKYEYYNRDNTLTILPADTWEQKNNLPENSTPYVFGFSKEDLGYVLINEKLYQYNASSDNWIVLEELKTLNSMAYIQAIGLIDEDLLIMDGKTLKSYSFFGNYTMARADFPGTERWGAVSFVVNNTFYYGLGHDYNEYQNDLWKYDLDTDEWTRVADCQSREHENSTTTFADEYAFVKDGLVYVEEFIYDYKTDRFTNNESSFIPSKNRILIEDKVYAIGKDDYIFDGFDDNRINYKSKTAVSNYSFEDDVWIENTYCPGVPSEKYFSFEINGKIYIGGYNRYNNADGEFWEFTPVEY